MVSEIQGSRDTLKTLVETGAKKAHSSQDIYPTPFKALGTLWKTIWKYYKSFRMVRGPAEYLLLDS